MFRNIRLKNTQALYRHVIDERKEIEREGRARV